MTGLWSLNEIEALSRSAARGAGYDWGLAEEAGRAVRWLDARDLPGAGALVALLDWREGQTVDAIRPDPARDGWCAGAGPICPLLSGCAIADRGGLPGADRARIGPVMAPLLIVPFVVWAAGAAGRSCSLAWQGGRVVVPEVGDLLAQAGETAAAMVEIGFGAPRRTPLAEGGFRARAGQDTVARLRQYAGRTRAPATEESRRMGAGAGLSDND